MIALGIAEWFNDGCGWMICELSDDAGWWLEYDEHRRSCPVYIFYLVRKSELERDKNWGAWEREYIKMRGSFEEGRQKDQQQ